MTCLSKLQEQLENTMLLRDVGISCRDKSNLNLDVVSKTVGDETFRCLFGYYLDASDTHIPYDPGATAVHFGITKEEFSFLFGPSTSSTVTERLMMIDAHIEQLEKAILARAINMEAA